MTVLKILADGFHEGGWGMWPILIAAHDHDGDPHRARRVPAPRRHRQGKAGGSPSLADLRRQHPGRDQGLLGQLDAADPHRPGGPDARQPLRRGDQRRDGRGGAARAAAAREADRLPGDARQPGDARRPARHHHRSHQVVRRRRRCRPVAEGDAAVEGHLGGDELHRLRSLHRHHRPRGLRVPERQDPERPRRHRRGEEERFESAVPGQGGHAAASPAHPNQNLSTTTTKNKENDSCFSWSTFRKAAGACGPSSFCSAITISSRSTASCTSRSPRSTSTS